MGRVLMKVLSAASFALEIRAFVPSRDFDLSKRFYCALGFQLEWSNAELAYLSSERVGFFLLNGDTEGAAQAHLYQLVVADVDDWWERVRGAARTFGIKLERPVTRPWGTRDLLMRDPSGVQWRVAQFLQSA
jgi:catechol 2,3-dioxygenase-like lactoylglutathione lyase family enzyme